MLLIASSVSAQTNSPRWSDEKANDWYQRQPWLVGSISAGDRDQRGRVWQADTFDRQEIDKE